MEGTVEAAPEGSRAVEAEMEETVEAAATVINYLGASIVEAKCRELVVQARGAEEAAHVARIRPHRSQPGFATVGGGGG